MSGVPQKAVEAHAILKEIGCQVMAPVSDWVPQSTNNFYLS